MNHKTFDYKAVKPAFGLESLEDIDKNLLEFFHNDTDDRKKDCKSKIIHKVRRNAAKYEGAGHLHDWWMNFWGTSSIMFSEYLFSDIYDDDGTGSLRNEKALRDRKWHDFVDLLEYNAAINFIYDKKPYIDIRLLWLDRNYKENLKDKNLKAGTKLNFTYYRGDRTLFCSSINTQIFLRGYVKESVDISDEQTIQMEITKDVSALDLFENYLSNPVAPRFSTYGGFRASLEPDAEDPNLWNAIIISVCPKIFSADGYSTSETMTGSTTYNDILFEFIKGLAYQLGNQMIFILL
ncbi:hypothetical protein EZS27_013084 [termite gut metagenome]|uniref:Uncharacterized protein n=1 Tax=termite gut metagenome TaxID=433724 RepID=A0A5J4RZV5_9ZZZZ